MCLILSLENENLKKPAVSSLKEAPWSRTLIIFTLEDEKDISFISALYKFQDYIKII